MMKKILSLILLSVLTLSVPAQVEILDAGQISATCSNGRRGAEINMKFKVKNLKGSRIRACCLISPMEGDGRVLPGTDPAGEYTVMNGMSGQEQELLVASDEARLTATFFVPFSVMNFNGNYSAQSLKSEIRIYQEGSNDLLASLSQRYSNLATHSVSVSHRSDSCEFETDYLGGCLVWDIFAACAGNEIVIPDLPKWITRDEEGLHVLDNESTDPRSTVLYVSSSEGGNVVRLNIKQGGRAAGESATAVVNKVWTERVDDANDPVGIFIIHVDCEVNGARGKDICLQATFYMSDGETPLVNALGNPIVISNVSTADYAEAVFDDFTLRSYFRRVVGAQNNSGREAKFYICVSDDGGKNCLARSGPYTISW